MIPVSFKEANTVYAENQKEYMPLPAYACDDGEVISCWRLTVIERLIILFTGRI